MESRGKLWLRVRMPPARSLGSGWLSHKRLLPWPPLSQGDSTAGIASDCSHYTSFIPHLDGSSLTVKFKTFQLSRARWVTRLVASVLTSYETKGTGLQTSLALSSSSLLRLFGTLAEETHSILLSHKIPTHERKRHSLQPAPSSLDLSRPVTCSRMTWTCWELNLQVLGLNK